MTDGRSGRRRVITARLRDGREVIVVLEVTPDGYIAGFRTGADEAVLFDPLGVSKLVGDLRDLQAIALQGVRWRNIG